MIGASVQAFSTSETKVQVPWKMTSTNQLRLPFVSGNTDLPQRKSESTDACSIRHSLFNCLIKLDKETGDGCPHLLDRTEVAGNESEDIAKLHWNA